MRRLALMLLATSSLGGLVAEAPAADIPPRMVTKVPTVAPVAYYNWSGCYVGGHIGGGWGRKNVSNWPEFGGAFAGFTDDIDGFLGGVQAGCNYQVNPNWVIGIEGQWSWSNVKGDFYRDPFFRLKGSPNGTFSARTDWLGTLTARFGYTWDRWMIYGKAGVAWAHDKYSLVGIGDSAQSLLSLNASETRTGWMLGVGLEYAFLNNWSAKLEYNYMDFGNKAVTLAGLFDATPLTTAIDIDQRIHVVKFGLNYRFNWGPGAAKY